ncbi:serine/threonine protein kinase [Pendulispora rubella]|uniref:Serine/threonine protein kinase n=1 Tax=Pendulispora rubella TaxID=2741070 RepID=A0ABZ2KX39_9BACT
MLSASQETGEPVRILPQRGDVLIGKYRIDRVIGDGGMCIVYAAEHLQLEDWVAIKVLRTEWVDRPEVVERFLREGKTATRIRSEHVVRTFDVGTLDDGTPCLVMEHLVGSDLDALLTANGPLPVPAAVDYLLQAGEAIGEAHQLGIVHRDLKPANLFLTHRADGSPWIKVLDFGISKLAPRAFALTGRELALTGTHSIMGSPRYMSPEQMRSSMEVDHRADIWALGVILHELIAGHPPFDGETMPEICANILQSPAPPLTTLCPDVLPDMEAVVLRCLEKDPAKRFQNLGELAAALREFGTPAGRASAHRIMGIFQSGATMYGRTSGQMPESGPAWGSTDPTWRPGPRKRRSFVRTLGIALGSTAIVACGAITAMFALRHATPTNSAEAPAPSAVLSWENQAAPAAPPPPSSAAPSASTEPPAVPAASETVSASASASASADSKKSKHGAAKARGSAAPTGPSSPSSDSLSTSPRGSATAAPTSSESLFEERK